MSRSHHSPRARWGRLVGRTLAPLVAASCLRTADGGCGGPESAEPCRCTEDVTGVEPLAGPTEARTGTDADPGGVVVVHAEVEPAHLMPLLRPDAWCEHIVSHDVYEALLRQDPFTHELGPELAESYEVSEDGRVMTFHLRRDARWHDGEPFTSADVVFTFDTIRDPAVLAATARSHLETVESWEAPDPYTFRMTLREPSYLLLRHLHDLVIIPRHLFGEGDVNTHPNLRHPVGTGPFRFVSWRTGRDMVLERNDAYWGTPARLDRVVYRFAQDRTLALQMLRRGEIDFMPRLPLGTVDQVREDRELQRTYRLLAYFAPGYSFIVYNVQRRQFQDPSVRRAMSMLVDRETIVCALQGCLGRVTSGPFPVGHEGADPTIGPLPFDPPAARRLLDAAGYSPGRGGLRRRLGRPLRFTLLVPAVSADSQRMASLIQQDMLRAGVTMDTYTLDWAVFLQRLQDHDFDAAMLVFSVDWETDYSTLFHSSQVEGGMNYGAFRSAEVDRTLERLRSELDASRRIELQHALHRLLHEQQPQTFLLSRVESSLYHRAIEGVAPGVPWFDERTWALPADRRGPDGRPAR